MWQPLHRAISHIRSGRWRTKEKGRSPPPQRADVLQIPSGVASMVLAMNHDAAHKYLYTLAPEVADVLRLVVPEAGRAFAMLARS